jgi:predicted N-acetyltransferase YhbS
MEFRAQKPSDSLDIKVLFETVFSKSESEQEGALIGNLVKEMMASTNSRDLYGFVADDDGKIVGAIFFSRLTFQNDLDVFILGPVAVHAERQGLGIGRAVIMHGLRELENRGICFVITYGDPAFYSRVGFHHISQHAIEAPHSLSQPEGWLGQSLTEEPIETISGHCTCVKALDNPVYW